MKIAPDHPDFTAWLMGELPHDQSAAFEREIAADPALQLAAQEQQQFLQQLSQWMGGSSEVLNARQREKIFTAARYRDVPQAVSLPAQRVNRGWGWITLATAALAVIGTWVGWQFPLNGGKTDLSFDEVTREIALLPADAAGFPGATDGKAPPATTSVGGNAVVKQQTEMWSRKPDEYMRLVAKRLATGPLPSMTELPAQRERGFVRATEYPVAPLPLRIGTASWSWVKRCIIEQGRLPHASLIRVEEIVQAFASASKSSSEQGKITFRALALPGDTSSDRKLVLFTLHNGEASQQELEWSYRAPKGVSYRLIGFGSSTTVNESHAQWIMPGASVQVMLEIIQPSHHQDLGTLSVRRQGEESSVAVTHETPDADMKFMRLLFDYCQWLRNSHEDPATLVDAVDRIEGEDISLEQRSALSVMDKSFNLPRE